jgi:hypothetical protein
MSAQPALVPRAGASIPLHTIAGYWSLGPSSLAVRAVGTEWQGAMRACLRLDCREGRYFDRCFEPETITWRMKRRSVIREEICRVSEEVEVIVDSSLANAC